MKKISLWAKDHKWGARFTIIFSFLILSILGIVAGLLLTDRGVSLSYNLFIVFLTLYSIGFLAYPSRTLKGKRLVAHTFYIRQKSCDALLVTMTFCLLIYLGNHSENLIKYFSSANATITTNTSFPKDSSLKNYKPIKEFYASMKDADGHQLKWKERKKLLKEQVRAIKKSDMSNGGKVALIVLSVLVALGLIYLIAALACNLSCSGSEAAAAIVAIGGTGLVIFLLVIAIRAILGNRRKRKQLIEAEEAKKAG